MSDAQQLDYHERFEHERAAGRFVIPRCAACGQTFWHPRRRCPHCLSDRVEFVEPTWPAHIYSYTINHRPKEGATPMVGYVELDDGLRLLVNLEVPQEGTVIGTAVRPEVRRTGDDIRFVFVPAAS